MGIEFIVLIAFMVLMLWWMSRNAKKQQERERERRDSATVLGANVVTHSGFFGTVVDVDGDAITLESPSGIETVWLRSSIAQAMDIPVADVTEEEAREDDNVGKHEADEEHMEVADDADGHDTAAEEGPVSEQEGAKEE